MWEAWEIPYSKWDLIIAGTSLGDKLEASKLEELGKEFEGRMPPEMKDRNKKIAESHGISVKQLIDSPNYQILCDEYNKKVVQDLVSAIQKKLNITNIQAWAILAGVIGLLD